MWLKVQKKLNDSNLKKSHLSKILLNENILVNRIKKSIEKTSRDDRIVLAEKKTPVIIWKNKLKKVIVL